METIRLPYVQSLVTDQKRQERFFASVVKRCEGGHSYEVAKLFGQIIRDADIENDQNLRYLFSALAERLYSDHKYGLPLAKAAAWMRADRGADIRWIRRMVDSTIDSEEVSDFFREEFDLIVCDDCGELEFGDESANVDGHLVCRTCIRNNYVYSHYLGEYIPDHRSVTALDSSGSEVCLDCDDIPGDFHYDDDLEMYVHDDYATQILRDYHDSKHDQEPISDKWTERFGRFMGVELEVEVGDGDRARIVERLNDAINGGEVGHRVFFERDGSLQNGFEVITQPMSLQKIRETFGFLNQRNLVGGLKSHDTTTCGLHIHVSRQGLSSLQIAKMVCFVNDPDNKWMIEAVARRYSTGYCTIREKRMGTAHMSADRYEAINLTNRKTIEFRIFKGSLKYDAVVAAAEFVHALVEFTKPSESSLKSINASGFLNFVQKKMPKECATFLRYLGERSKSSALAA